MEEKELIKSELKNINKFNKIMIILGCVAEIVLFLIDFIDGYEWGIFTHENPIFMGFTFWGYDILGIIVGVSLVVLIINWVFGEISLIVTDKRVIGIANFRKQVDLPLDSISAIGKGLFSSVAVSTSSGIIRFAFIKNIEAVYKTISELLIERQYDSNCTALENEVSRKSESMTDDLRRLKSLLDEGIITEEEFNAKKRQLLGL